MVYAQFLCKTFSKNARLTPPAPSALSFAQHCKIFSRMQPIYHFPLNHFHLKTFCNEKYFTAKQTETKRKILEVNIKIRAIVLYVDLRQVMLKRT